MVSDDGRISIDYEETLAAARATRVVADEVRRQDGAQGPTGAAVGIPGAITASRLPTVGSDLDATLKDWAEVADMFAHALDGAVALYKEGERDRVRANEGAGVPSRSR